MILPLGQGGPPQDFRAGFFFRIPFIAFPVSFVKRIVLVRVLPLGQGGQWVPPRCPGGSGNFPDRYFYHFQSRSSNLNENINQLPKIKSSKLNFLLCPVRRTGIQLVC